MKSRLLSLVPALLCAIEATGCAPLLGLSSSYEDGTDGSGGGAGGEGEGGSPSSGGTGGVAAGGSSTGGSFSGGAAARLFEQISAGDTHACGLEASGTVVCWGGFYDEVRTVPGGAFDRVASGYENACALADGFATCWGADAGLRNPPNVMFGDVALGSGFACGVAVSGTLHCWGDAAPTPPAGTFERVAATESFACAVADDASLHCFGAAAPSAPPGAFEAVEAGRAHLCALTTPDRLLVCFGDDFYGQTNSPNGVFGGVSSGGDASCAISGGGAVRCFGASTSGQLDAPAGVWASVEVGGDFACALDGGGSVACWGAGVWGGTNVPPR